MNRKTVILIMAALGILACLGLAFALHTLRGDLSQLHGAVVLPGRFV